MPGITRALRVRDIGPTMVHCSRQLDRAARYARMLATLRRRQLDLAQCGAFRESASWAARAWRVRSLAFRDGVPFSFEAPAAPAGDAVVPMEEVGAAPWQAA